MLRRPLVGLAVAALARVPVDGECALLLTTASGAGLGRVRPLRAASKDPCSSEDAW